LASRLLTKEDLEKFSVKKREVRKQKKGLWRPYGVTGDFSIFTIP
jgi:hypothetical protein